MSRAAAIPRFLSPPGSPGQRGVRGANTLRPTGITCPNGTAIATAYTDAQADALSRADAIKDGATVLCTWSYIGLSMVAAQSYPAAAGTELSYGSSGDAYAGYDRFGRIAETLWKTGTTVQVHTKYGHNRAGGVTWRRNLKAASLPGPATQDQHTWYDGLRQVERHDRGGLTPATGPPYAGISNLRRQENFAYGETGNWLSYQRYAPALVQDRAHNGANQITGITGPPGVVQPAYDDVENMTALPAPGDWTKAYTCQWDAWNRLVQIKDGGTVVQANSYDGLTRRIQRTTGGDTTDLYYDTQWRCIEERVSGAVKADYVYDPGDRWNLIRRRRSVDGLLDEVRFVLRDFLDPVAIITPAGTVDERYGYSAFGVTRIMDANFAARAASACDWTWLFHGEFIDDETGLYNYGYRFYSPGLGRWLSRDPIGEEDGLNLYGFAGNAANGLIDYLGLADGPILNVNISRDSSVPKDLSAAQKLDLDSNKESLKRIVEKCCDEYSLLCKAEIKFNEDFDGPKVEAPPDGYGQEGQPLRNYHKNSGKSGGGNLDLLLTTRPIAEGSAFGLAMRDTGAIISLPSPGYTLPHELGHCAGYDCGDMDSGQHNSKKGHIMNPQGGSDKVDKCYCEKIANLFR